MAYSSVAIIALVVLFITNYDLLFKRRASDKIPARRHYRFFLISVGFFYICDLIWGLFDTYNVHFGDYAITVFFFALMSLSVCLWSFYVVAYLGRRKFFSLFLKIIGLVLLASGIVLITINFFQPIMFRFVNKTVDGVPVRAYEALAFRTVYYIAQGVMFLLTSIYAFVFAYFNRKETKARTKHIAIGIFGLEMTVFITMQIIFPSAPIYSFGYLLGLLVINTFVVTEQKKEYRVALAEGLDREKKAQEELGETKQMAYVDSLTGAKSMHAYVELEESIDRMIADETITDFAVVVLDLNDLKFVNDKLGHDAGDQYLVDSVKIIRHCFKDADLYRFGGDEFALLLKDANLKNCHEKIDAFNRMIEKNFETGEPIISVGLSIFRPGQDNTYRSVFKRADERMYIRKKQLKEIGRVNVSKSQKTKLNPEEYEEYMKAELQKNREESLNRSSPRFAFYKLFYRNEDYSLMDMLNNSTCDEIVEINLKEDTFNQRFHVDGKYFTPTISNVSFVDLFDFTSKHIVHPDDREIYIKFMNPEGLLDRLRNSEIPYFDCEQFRYKLQDGSYRYVEQCLITGLENGIPDGVIRLYVFDVQNYKARQIGVAGNEKNIISVGRDSVTSLLREKEFLVKAETMITDQPDVNWCLASIDIKHFRFFDEWYGRDSGDLLLAKIGVALAESEAEFNAVSGYFGKDDFAMLMPYDEAIIKTIYDRIKEMIMTFGSTAGFTPAFGIAMVEKGASLVDIFDRATIASAKAKSDISNRICVYTPEMQFLAQKEYRLLSEYAQALKDDEITFYLQPQCRISSSKIVGVEALARWIKKDGTIVSPGEFIPVLEKYGFIPDLDIYLWDKACAELSRWIKEGHFAVPVSFNVARADLFAIDVADHFIKLAEKYNIPHNLIKIEITESSYVEASDLVDGVVRRLHDNGFMVLMDDFGSGYSSLNMLSNLKIDVIKLDAHFLHMEGEDYEKAIHILESVVNMAKTIGLPIIVEGVEKKDQVDFIESLGCRYIQGYYFYKPMPFSELEKLVTNADNVDPRGFVVKLNEQVRIREFLDKNIYSDSMLNNIIGPVAFYSWTGEKTDIVRFNEQFYKAVHVPDFAERLENIERFIHAEDGPKMHNAFKKAIENKLNGATEILRFYTPDGTVLSFSMHFYYMGKKEGGESFYGAAQNVTELSDLKEEKRLMASYSKEGLAFIRKVDNQYIYSVMSSGLSDVFDITPSELEREINDREFARKRVVNRKKYDAFTKSFLEYTKEKKNFEASFEVYDCNRQPLTLHLSFTCVDGLSNNIEYILRTTFVG